VTRFADQARSYVGTIFIVGGMHILFAPGWDVLTAGVLFLFGFGRVPLEITLVHYNFDCNDDDDDDDGVEIRVPSKKPDLQVIEPYNWRRI
jgi:hypothetical protein